jgi:hypothetical protein
MHKVQSGIHSIRLGHFTSELLLLVLGASDVINAPFTTGVRITFLKKGGN